MSERRQSSQPQATGEIHLRQTAQVHYADHVRTLEIAITLPANADEAAISRAIQTATAGMQGLTEQLAAHVAALQTSAPSPISANGHTLPTPASSELPEPVAPAPEKKAQPAAKGLTMAGFLKAASDVGYSAADIPQALGVVSITDIDLAAALERLRDLATQAQTSNPRGFAEEIGPYDTAETDSVSDIAEAIDEDEPDFGPVAEEAPDGVFAVSTPSEAPELAAMRQREDAQRRLKTLRSIRALGAVATPEQRTALQNLVIVPLGRDTAQELIIAIWNPQMGEKLNAARTRALVEWAKEDEQFEQSAAQVIDLARQPATQEG